MFRSSKLLIFFTSKFIFYKKVLDLLGKKRNTLPFIFLMYFFLSLIELIGLGLLGGFVVLLLDYDINNYFLFKIISFSFDFNFTKNNLIYLTSFFLFIVFLFKTFFGIFINYIIVNFVNKTIASMRVKFFSTYININYDDYLSKHSSELIATVTSFIARFGLVIQNSIRILSDLIIMLFIIIFLFVLNPLILSLLILGLFIVIFVYYNLFMYKLRIIGEKSNIEQKIMLKNITEGLEGLKEVRVSGLEYFFINNIKKSTRIISRNDTILSIISLAPRYFIELIITSFIVIFVSYTVFSNYDMKIIIPTMSIFIFAALRIMPMVYQFINSYSLITFCEDAVEKLYFNYQNIKLNQNYEKQDNKKNIVFKSLKLKDVEFKYKKSNLKILQNLYFTLYKGDSIGIVGESGIGKTTLIDVILMLLDTNKGEITINDFNIQNYKRQWMLKVAYLPQQVFLIDDTILNNITLGTPSLEIDHNKVYECIKNSQLDKLLDSLPDGINTFIGERGLKVSGGQRQRLALARAFYHDKEIIIMDESTSSIDEKTEKEIIDRIKFIKKQKTIIVIAHRNSTVAHCDKIYELKNGNLNQIK